MYIHQIWLQGEQNLPKQYKKRVETMRKIYGNAYHLWSGNEIRNLIQEGYTELLNAYDGYPDMIMRVDLGKYVILHAFGGLYLDMDIKEKYDGSLKDLLNKEGDKLIFLAKNLPLSAEVMANRSPMINNNFMNSPCSHHPFYTMLLKDVPLRAVRKPYDIKMYYIMESIGPFFLTEMVNNWDEESQSTNYEKYYELPGNNVYIQDEQARSWMNREFYDTRNIIILFLLILYVYLAYRVITWYITPNTTTMIVLGLYSILILWIIIKLSTSH